MTVAKPPLAKDLADFDFDAADINEALVRDLAAGGFIEHQRVAPKAPVPRNPQAPVPRDVVPVGAAGAGTTHAAIAIARACIRRGARGRFFNVVDPVNRLDAETRAGRQGRIADHLCRLDFVAMDDLGYLPIPSPAGACRSISSASSTGAPRSL